MNYLQKVNFSHGFFTEEIYFNSFPSLAIYKNSYRLFTQIAAESTHLCFLSPNFIRSSRVEDNALTIPNLGSLAKVLVEAQGIVPLTKMVITMTESFTSTKDIILNTIIEKWAPLYRGGVIQPLQISCIKNNLIPC